MKLTKTVKIQIYPADRDKNLLMESMRAYSKACDFVSQYIYTTHDLNQVSIHKAIYRDIRRECGVSSQMACNSIRTTIGSYKTNLSSGKGWTRCKFKVPQMVLSWSKTCRIVRRGISIGTINDRVVCDYDKQRLDEYLNNGIYHFGAARLVCKHNKYYLHIAVSFDADDVPNTSICNVVGIDRGIRFIATTYDSQGKTKMYQGGQLEHKRKHYKKLRQQLQIVRTPSARRRIRTIGQRENRWMQDINHCISKALVQSNPQSTLFVIEDLCGIHSNIRKIDADSRDSFVSWAFYDLEKKLLYKSAENNQKVIKVDPSYTSQTCPKCGHVHKGNRNKHTHTFCCRNCGYKSNDDRVGAMNLYRMGIEYLVESQVSISDL